VEIVKFNNMSAAKAAFSLGKVKFKCLNCESICSSTDYLHLGRYKTQIDNLYSFMAQEISVCVNSVRDKVGKELCNRYEFVSKNGYYFLNPSFFSLYNPNFSNFVSLVWNKIKSDKLSVSNDEAIEAICELVCLLRFTKYVLAIESIKSVIESTLSSLSNRAKGIICTSDEDLFSKSIEKV